MRAQKVTMRDDYDGNNAADDDNVAAKVGSLQVSSDDEQQPQHPHGDPPPGHECLCTMEDITKEDGNYGELAPVS